MSWPALKILTFVPIWTLSPITTRLVSRIVRLLLLAIYTYEKHIQHNPQREKGEGGGGVRQISN